MATQPSNPPADGQQLTPEAQAALDAGVKEQIESSPGTQAEQAATAAAIENSERGPQLPAEADIDAFMEEMKAKFATMSAELQGLKDQQAAALTAGGGPMALRYAQGAADKVGALVTAHPDAPPGHFAPALEAAKTLSGEAARLVKDGSGDTGAIEKAGAALEKFATRTHWRNWGKHIDWSAILDDTETAVEEALKLAA